MFGKEGKVGDGKHIFRAAGAQLAEINPGGIDLAADKVLSVAGNQIVGARGGGRNRWGKRRHPAQRLAGAAKVARPDCRLIVPGADR